MHYILFSSEHLQLEIPKRVELHNKPEACHDFSLTQTRPSLLIIGPMLARPDHRDMIGPKARHDGHGQTRSGFIYFPIF